MFRQLAVLVILLLVASPLWGLGEQEVGNKPVNVNNYPTPTLMPVLNDKHRVYRWWVNGNEKFFFSGDTIALNEALENFAKVDAKRREVVLRPGPTVANTFNNESSMAYNWNVHLIGGIAGSMRRHEKGELVWPDHPTMHIYVGGKIQLSELEIPKGVSVISLADLRDRYLGALSSPHQTVRGWTCGNIAALNPYDTTAMKRIAALLDDEVDWVKLNAAGALKSYGALAEEVKDSLQKASKSDDESVSKRADETMAEISKEKIDANHRRDFEKMLQAIDRYIASIKE